jgi:hypothetical protein
VTNAADSRAHPSGPNEPDPTVRDSDVNTPRGAKPVKAASRRSASPGASPPPPCPRHSLMPLTARSALPSRSPSRPRILETRPSARRIHQAASDAFFHGFSAGRLVAPGVSAIGIVAAAAPLPANAHLGLDDLGEAFQMTAATELQEHAP